MAIIKGFKDVKSLKDFKDLKDQGELLLLLVGDRSVAAPWDKTKQFLTRQNLKF